MSASSNSPCFPSKEQRVDASCCASVPAFIGCWPSLAHVPTHPICTAGLGQLSHCTDGEMQAEK